MAKWTHMIGDRSQMLLIDRRRNWSDSPWYPWQSMELAPPLAFVGISTTVMTTQVGTISWTQNIRKRVKMTASSPAVSSMSMSDSRSTGRTQSTT